MKKEQTRVQKGLAGNIRTGITIFARDRTDESCVGFLKRKKNDLQFYVLIQHVFLYPYNDDMLLNMHPIHDILQTEIQIHVQINQLKETNDQHTNHMRRKMRRRMMTKKN